MGDGMTTRYPDLFLLYAINPNRGGQRSAAARGQAKGMGQFAGMPDVHLPVARGPFIGLYLEFKQAGRYGQPEQRAIADQLRAAGHCVIEVQSCQEAIAVTFGYLGIVSPFPADEVDLAQRRAFIHEHLTPKRR
jgi:hypothetical protein